jgi:hypothetical protein
MTKNEVMIGDGLTQGTKVIGLALHPMIVVTDTEVAFLEYEAPDVELQNTGIAVTEKLGLENEPCLASVLRQFSNDLKEFGGESTENLSLQEI